MTNTTDHITKANTIIGIITGLIALMVWLTGKSGLPELIFGKNVEVVLPPSKSSAGKNNHKDYKQYIDSLFNVQEQENDQTVRRLNEKIDNITYIPAPVSPKPTNCDFEPAVYYGGISDRITFHSVKGNIYQFNGEISSHAVNGKVVHTGNKLNVIKGTGNVTGEFTLLNGCNKLVGTLKDNLNPALFIYDVNLTKQ